MITLGISSLNKTVDLDFNNYITSHALISGKTGSGKSTLVKWIIQALIRQNEPERLAFVFIDFTGGEDFMVFANSEYALHSGIITSLEEADFVFAWLDEEAKRRHATKDQDRAIFVFIDEAQVILEDKDMQRRIAHIAATYRKRNIHLVTITQDPIGKKLGDLGIKKNSVMIAGRFEGSGNAAASLGLGKTGANTLLGFGDFMYIAPDGVRRFSGVLADENTMNFNVATTFPIILPDKEALTSEEKERAMDYHITDRDKEIVRKNFNQSDRKLRRLLARPGKEMRSQAAVIRIRELVEQDFNKRLKEYIASKQGG